MSEVSKKEIISFVIPVLNGERFVNDCLEHIISQMEQEDEILIIDNGSTDDSVALASAYKQVKIFECPGLTIAALRNIGASRASGNILAFIDVDCFIRDSWRTSVDLILSDRSIDATGSLCECPKDAAWVEKAWWSSKPLIATKANYIVGGNFVIRRTVFQAIKGFDEKLVTDEDADIGARLNRAGYVIVDDPRIGSVHQGNPKTLHEFVLKEKWHALSILETMKKHGPDKPMVMTIAFLIASLFSLMVIVYSIFGDSRVLVLSLLILVIPIITAVYRVFQFRNYRFFFQLAVLYLVFYIVRSMTVVELLTKSTFSHRQRAGSA